MLDGSLFFIGIMMLCFFSDPASPMATWMEKFPRGRRMDPSGTVGFGGGPVALAVAVVVSMIAFLAASCSVYSYLVLKHSNVDVLTVTTITAAGHASLVTTPASRHIPIFGTSRVFVWVCAPFPGSRLCVSTQSRTKGVIFLLCGCEECCTWTSAPITITSISINHLGPTLKLLHPLHHIQEDLVAIVVIVRPLFLTFLSG
ncbi:hypothetical protein CC2G_001897 [Coprinopsis cinerea AmutBmut pab1-1]|nr:hypothetical protein CC2G_001897 [Coprinopsis cinerea AmutBmut pab1-1]